MQTLVPADDVEYTKVVPHANCWNSAGHGTINVEQAIEYSCNCFFYEVGYRLGSKDNTTELNDSTGLALSPKYAKMFGLDSVSADLSFRRQPREFPMRVLSVQQLDRQPTTIQRLNWHAM